MLGFGVLILHLGGAGLLGVWHGEQRNHGLGNSDSYNFTGTSTN